MKIGAAVDLGPLHKGLNSAADSVNGFGASLAGLAAAAGVALSVNALKSYVMTAVDAVTESNKLATKVGFSTEAFQKLSYAARMSGVDQDLLATSLSQLSKRLRERGPPLTS